MANQNVRQAIKWAIQGMVANNSDHDFEKLCYEYALRKICGNIVMPTGGGQGDCGRDFYTVPIYDKNGEQTENIGFQCSLQSKKSIKNKIKDDIESISSKHPCIKTVYFFAGSDIAESEQQKLINLAKINHDVTLNIIDPNQLSQLLATFKNYDLVENYLHISSAIYPRPEEESWYSELKQKYETNDIVSIEDFYEVDAAIRETVNDKELSIDTQFWIDKLNIFKNSQSDFFAKNKALYTMAYATLRGQNKLDTFRDLAVEYINSFEETDNLHTLENAVCIISYATAVFHQNIEFPDKLISSFFAKIQNKVNLLLNDTSILKKSHILFLKMMLSAGNIHHDIPPYTNTLNNFLIDIDALLSELELHPFFSVQTVYKVIDVYNQPKVKNILNISKQKWEEIILRIDKLIEIQEGKGAVGDKIKDRMINLFEQKDYFGAINEGHKLKEVWMQYDSYFGCVIALNTLAKSYEELGLYYAAKHYYILSTNLCIRSDKAKFLSKSLYQIYQLAHLDYYIGNWYSFLDLVASYFYVYYATERKEFDLDNRYNRAIVFYLIAIKKLASFDNTYDSDVTGIIQNMNCDDDLKNHILDLYKSYKFETVSDMWAEIQKQLQGRPFKDVGPNVSINFNTSGVQWEIKTENIDSNLILAEEYAAILQIVLAELHGLDIMHIKTRVVINISPVDSNAVKITEKGTNDYFEFNINVPNMERKLDINDFIMQMFISVMDILTKCSLLRDDKILPIVENLLKNNIYSRFCFINLYRHAYTHIYDKNKLSKSIKQTAFNETQDFVVNIDTGIFKYDELAPDFDEESIKNHMKDRYSNCFIILQPTLDVLKHNPQFIKIINEKRGLGFSDAEITMALANMIMNSKVATERVKTGIQFSNEHDFYEWNHKKMIEIRNNSAKYNSPIPDDPIFFDSQSWDAGLLNNYIIELVFHKLQNKTSVPKFNALLDFLITRYKYRQIDVPHKDILS